MKSLFAIVMACCVVSAQAQSSATVRHAGQWVGSWATSQQAPEPQNNQPGVDAAKLSDATVRQVVHLSVGGHALRVHLSNAFGTQPLVVDSVYLAKPVTLGASGVVAGSERPVMFAGKPSVTIPIGAEYFSDPVSIDVPALGDVAISFHLPAAPMGQTGHPGAHATTWLVSGNHAADADLQNATKIQRWLTIAGIEVEAPASARAIVAYGDSITDGHASTTDGNDRWPDELARRLQADAQTKTIGVLNEGIGGNHLLTDGLGVNALARMDRDVLAQSGAKYVIVLEGINDLGMLSRQNSSTPEEHQVLVERMIAAYEQIILRAHARGFKVIGATMTPYVGSDYYHPAAASEADRLKLNAWIREPGHFDAVVDFDKAVRDPANPSRMLPAYDSGDHLHPGPAGYKAMGDAIPLTLFR
jgi:lysophospholipase L1-like esterase